MGLALGLVGLLVSGDDTMVSTPDRFDLDVFLKREQRFEALTLLVSAEVAAGVQGTAKALAIHATVRPEWAETTKRGQVRRGEGRTKHIAAFPDSACENFYPRGGLDPLSRQRQTHEPYTHTSEELDRFECQWQLVGFIHTTQPEQGDRRNDPIHDHQPRPHLPSRGD